MNDVIQSLLEASSLNLLDLKRIMHKDKSVSAIFRQVLKEKDINDKGNFLSSLKYYILNNSNVSNFVQKEDLEYLKKIKVSDLNDENLFKLSNFVKHLFNNLPNENVSTDLKRFLRRWVSNNTEFPEWAVEEIKSLDVSINKRTTVYKSIGLASNILEDIKSGKAIEFEDYTLWDNDKLESTGYVISTDVFPADVILDSEVLEKKTGYVLSSFNELIVNPGKYKCKIYKPTMNLEEVVEEDLESGLIDKVLNFSESLNFDSNIFDSLDNDSFILQFRKLINDGTSTTVSYTFKKISKFYKSLDIPNKISNKNLKKILTIFNEFLDYEYEVNSEIKQLERYLLLYGTSLTNYKLINRLAVGVSVKVITDHMSNAQKHEALKIIIDTVLRKFLINADTQLEKYKIFITLLKRFDRNQKMLTDLIKIKNELAVFNEENNI